MTDRVVTEPTPGRGGMDPGTGIAIALVSALLIGLLIYFFAVREDDGDGDVNPAPRSSNSQQSDAPETEAPQTSEPQPTAS